MQFAIWHRLFVEQPGLRPSPDEDPLDWVASDA
jgi:asparagine synthase (glutamine-hydrolysing)